MKLLTLTCDISAYIDSEFAGVTKDMITHEPESTRASMLQSLKCWKAN